MASEPQASAPATPSTPFNPSNPQQTYDPTWHTWSRFFRIISGTSTNREAQEYMHADSIANASSHCLRCESHRDWLLEYSPVVRFMRDKVSQLGVELDSSNVVCRRCDTLTPHIAQLKKAAFNRNFGIMLCANHLPNKGELEDTMAHEMVHAYDYLRFQYDERDLRHVACTEIRASMLSGECRWVREFWQRKQRHKFTQLFQDCVRRRAAQSVMAHKSCKDDVLAVKLVNEVWDSCFADTRPFDEIYR